MNITHNAKNIVDNCRFCWMCRHICPIGNATGHERCTARARSFAISMVERGATELSEVADNIYECTLCGACTNNCVTGFDPKVFVEEVKREVVLAGLTPDYIMALLERYVSCGNVYGIEEPRIDDKYYTEEGDTLFFAGADTQLKAPECAKGALDLLLTAGVKPAYVASEDSGFALRFLTGKTEETLNAVKKCAELLNKYKKVIVYDPVDLAFMLHEYREWGVDVTAELISFNDYLLSLIDCGKIKVKRGNNEYTLQDNYAYARELDDCESGRKLIAAVGVSRDMLLIGKEANLAGQLIMSEYMPAVMEKVALDRWQNAINMGCKTVVTENTAEYLALKATAPEGCRVITVEEMIKENM